MVFSTFISCKETPPPPQEVLPTKYWNAEAGEGGKNNCHLNMSLGFKKHLDESTLAQSFHPTPWAADVAWL